MNFIPLLQKLFSLTSSIFSERINVRVGHKKLKEKLSKCLNKGAVESRGDFPEWNSPR